MTILLNVKKWVKQKLVNKNYEFKEEMEMLINKLRDHYDELEELNKKEVSRKAMWERFHSRYKSINFMGMIYGNKEMSQLMNVKALPFPMLSGFILNDAHINYRSPFCDINSYYTDSEKLIVTTIFNFKDYCIETTYSMRGLWRKDGTNYSSITHKEGLEINQKDVMQNLFELNNQLEQAKEFYREYMKMVGDNATDIEINKFITKYKEYSELLYIMGVQSKVKIVNKWITSLAQNNCIYPSSKMEEFLKIVQISYYSLSHTDRALDDMLEDKKIFLLEHDFTELNSSYLKKKLEIKLENNLNEKEKFTPKRNKI